MTSVQIDQIKNESDMINLSQAELRSYYSAVSSLVTVEESTLKGLDSQRINYEGEIYNAEQEILQLDFQILESTSVLEYLINRESTLSIQSTILAEQIESTIYQIGVQDSTIAETSGEISSLTLERINLEGEIETANNKFDDDARAYSSLYLDYIQKVDDYETLLENIDRTSSFLESSIVVASQSQYAWETSYSTLQGLEREMSTLKDDESLLLQQQGEIEADIIIAEAAELSTIVAVQYYSSLYTTAEANRAYVGLVSSEVAAINLFSAASNDYDRYFQRLMGQTQQGGAIEDEAPLTEQELSTLIYAKKSLMDQRGEEVNRIRGEVANAKRTIEDAGTIAYETLISGIDQQIAQQYSSMYHYKELKRRAVEIDIPNYTTIRDKKLEEENDYLNKSTIFGEAYISTFIGYNQLLDSEFELRGKVLSNAKAENEAKERVISYFEAVYGTDYMPLRRMRLQVDSYANTGYQAYTSYNEERAEWKKDRYLEVLEATGAVTAAPAQTAEPTGAVTQPREISLLFNLSSIAAEDYISTMQAVSGYTSDTGGLEELIRKTIQDTETSSDPSTLASILSLLPSSLLMQGGARVAKQRGGQVTTTTTTGSIEKIDADLTNELFDLGYLLYTQGVESAPASLTFDGKTVSFGPDYIPQSVSAFGMMGGNMSSLHGLQVISTQKASDYADADKLVKQYQAQYTSVSQTITSYETTLATTINNLKLLGIQSTNLIQQINTYNIQAAKEAIELAIAFNDQEKAAYEFRESYIRESRVTVQNTYEDAIRNQIATISSQQGQILASKGDTSTIINIAELIQPEMEKDPIKSAFNSFQNITAALTSFSNLYKAYDDRGYLLSNYFDNSSKYQTLQSEYASLVASNITDPQNSSIALNVMNKYNEIVNMKTVVDKYQTDIAPYDKDVQGKKEVVNSNYTTYVTLSTRTEVEKAISSILSGGMQAGYASI